MTSACIHAGSDALILRYDGQTHILERNTLHETLSPVLHRLYQSGVRTMRVITGPGSFTILRVACLLLNTMQSLTDEKISFHTIHKDDLYQWLYGQGHTPRHTALFIGQRKNLWLIDHKEKTHQTIKHAALDEVSDSYVFDMMTGISHNDMLAFSYEKKRPYALWNEKQIDLSDAPWETGTMVDPYYGLDPQIH